MCSLGKIVPVQMEMFSSQSLLESFALDDQGTTGRGRNGRMTGVRVALLSPKHAQLTWEPAERAVRYTNYVNCLVEVKRRG